MRYNEIKTSLLRNLLFYLSILSTTFYSFKYFETSYTGDIIVKGLGQWYDLPIHMKYVRHILSTPIYEIFKNHPLNHGESFNYHFFTDALSAVIYSIYSDWDLSLTLPVLVFSILSLFEIRKYFLTFQPHKTVDKALLGFLFFGGFGFIFTPYWLDLMYGDPNLYNINNYAYNFLLTPLTQMIFSQRGIIVGTFFFFKALNIQLKLKSSSDLIILFITYFFLSISQFQGIIAMFFFLLLSYLSDRRNLKPLLTLIVTSLITYFYFYFSPTTINYLELNFLWLFKANDSGSFLFSNLLSYGLFGMLYFLSLFKKEECMPFHRFPLFIFLIINLVQFSPNEWDNVKVLWYTFPFVSLVSFSQIESYFKDSRTIKFIMSFMLLGTGLSSYFKQMFTDSNDFTLITGSELQTSKEIQDKVNGKKVIIESKHNHLITLSTDAILHLSYFPTLQTYGHQLEDDWKILKLIWDGDPNPDISHYLKLHDIQILAFYKGDLYDIGLYKRIKWLMKTYQPIKANIDRLREIYEIEFEDENIVLFRAQ